MGKKQDETISPLRLISIIVLWTVIPAIIMVSLVSSLYFFVLFNTRCDIGVQEIGYINFETAEVDEEIRIIKTGIPKIELYQHFPTKFDRWNLRKTYYFDDYSVICKLDFSPIKDDLPDMEELIYNKTFENNVYIENWSDEK